MREITGMVPQYEQFGNRVEMGEVRRLKVMWGVGKDSGAVVMNSGP